MKFEKFFTKFNRFFIPTDDLLTYDVEAALAKEGLTKNDYQEICKRLSRPPNRNELGMFGVMWSEHCCYRNSKPLLSNFPTTGKNILVGPGENAGVVDIGCNQRLVFKIESHNHPSAVEPFQGAPTGVGGILRDIFTMGARPIAILNALRFGSLDDQKNVGLIQGVVAGIAHYGNCVGVPTVGGEVVFDDSYSGNPLVNAMALGLMETEEIVCSGASGIGYPVLYVGSTTGRDGMGGASFASAELTDTSFDDRPAVQVGDAFLEKGLIEACLEAFKSGDVVAAQDMGAAGLTCSCSEMSAKGNVGIELNLDLVPARESGMTAYEFLLSESQERMLFVIEPGSEKRLIKNFKRWGLEAEVVGKVIKENVVRILHNSKIVANIPSKALAEDTPIEKHNLLKEPPDFVKKNWDWNETQLPEASINGITSLKYKKELNWNNIILNLLDNPSIASKSWVYSQYDYQVQANTIFPPGKADAALVRLRPQVGELRNDLNNRAIAAVVDCPNRWVYLDPKRGSMAAVAEAARNISCVGAEPLAVTDNLNFSSPENPIGFWQLSQSCDGLAIACKEFNTPVTGGNVSLYNEIKSPNGTIQPIQPTPVVGMVGLLEDINHSCSLDWKSVDDIIYLLGVNFDELIGSDERITLSGSSYLETIHDLVKGRPPKIDLNLEKLIQSFLRKSIHKNLINSAHDVSDGGITISLAEACISSGLGVSIGIKSTNYRIDRLLFAEGGARVLISISSEKEKAFLSFLDSFNKDFDFQLPLLKLGVITNDSKLTIQCNNIEVVNIPVEEMKSNFENSLQNRIEKNYD